MTNLKIKAITELKETLKNNKADTATSCIFEYGYTIKEENGKIYFVVGHKEKNLRKILDFVIKKQYQYQMILNGIKDCQFINDSVCI